ncbi:MAG: sigma 54-interacting transcriptional regulator [Bacteroidetes bacterium]|nr:sigma 54-interacting transcriptional regulator [Bacteroidota bacterium]MBU1116474.1 sigma 54-interacting transcriptional regulator [Bacteroidota bacterium]MBU1797291.1 sigma 54-interacting transcriptional regulator [Bacteroidota bacterium]
MTTNYENINHIKTLSKKQFDALYELNQLINSEVIKDSLIEQALDLVINVINAERGLFTKYDSEKKDFSIISARNVEQENIKVLSNFSSNMLQEVIDKKEPVLYHDLQSDPHASQYDSVQLQNIKSVIGVPIIQNENVWGVILADSQKDRKEFTEENLSFLKFFSNLFSSALERVDFVERIQDENLILLNQLQANEQLPDMIGNSDAMRKVAKLFHKVAQSDATVLIYGESGTGKDLAAKAIHKLSKRKDYPYLAQFCGSIPDSLLESELFGYKKGAFTGANSDKKGLLEVANKGTFFFDEIADISSPLQAKLLRVLENKEIIRLGDTSVKQIDVRIVVATNKSLEKLVENGEFREDLFYRLNVFPIKLPPLRERREDIPLLVNHFVNELSNNELKIDSNAMKLMQQYQWPGNIRQLRNVIQRAVILCNSNRIEAEHIIIENGKNGDGFSGTLKDYEMQILKKRLEEFDGNRTAAAKSLGVSVRWVQNKIKEMEDDKKILTDKRN